MQKYPELLGAVVKAARLRADLSIKEVAERVDITDRYLCRIENEGQKPSFKVLCRLVHTLSIPGDYIFYPEKRSPMWS